MNTFFIMGGICLILAPLIYRYPMLLAGYNTMPKKEREKIDTKQLKRSAAGGIMVFGIITAFFGFLPDIRWVHYTYIGFSLIFLIVFLCLISTKKMQKR
ncbi:MAG: DUF3784 domain-containing protein [Bacteroidales bacterium]|nr:DUF3784 domain-containing protein [Porphyromonas sp.]MDD6934361.1 DUF3784 domain-containing protein [Bacteroidales bacterium]MDY3101944.1 DUF3784 domain-containing protein [Porphyromonas sp.]